MRAKATSIKKVSPVWLLEGVGSAIQANTKSEARAKLKALLARSGIPFRRLAVGTVLVRRDAPAAPAA